MPLVFVFLGALFIIVGVAGTQAQLLTQVKQDFAGKNNFFVWIIAIVAIGLIGNIPGLKPLSVALLALVVVAILLSNKGFFSQFASATGIGSNTNVGTVVVTSATSATTV
jgi:hypothetical protein